MVVDEVEKEVDEKVIKYINIYRNINKKKLVLI